MSVVTESEIKWSSDQMVEISLNEPDDFLKVRETLTRIGVASRKEKKIYQSCHILHKQGRYFLVHFKELFALDGKHANLTTNDVQRRNRLANCRAELVDYKGVKRKGTYMFTIDWAWENKAGMLDTNFSEDPEHKCAHMFRMDDGNFFAYPNNRTIWYDDAYMDERLTKNPGYKIDQNFYTVENTREEDVTTDDSYMTQFERP